MRKAVIVARGENEISQVTECMRFAVNNNMTVQSIVYSLEDLEQILPCDNYEFVLVTSPSRLTRKYSEFMTLRNQLAESGIQLISLN